jgi:hypothetical protein
MKLKQLKNKPFSFNLTSKIIETLNEISITQYLLNLFLFIGLTLCFLPSCKKEKPTFHLGQDIKDYCVFKQGSHWTYKDDSTNKVLEVYVSTVSTQNIDDSRFIEERTYVHFQSSFMYYYFLCHQCPSDGNWNQYNGDRLEFTLIEPDSSYGGGVAMWTSQKLNKDQIDPCGPFDHPNYIISEAIDTCKIDSTVFINVIHTNFHSLDASYTNPYSFSYDFYFAKHIGLIRLRENNLYKNVHRSISLITWSVDQ